MPYRGTMLNGDGTPASFIVYGLERFFGEDADRAIRLMIRRSRPGGACGAFLHQAEEGRTTRVEPGGQSGRESDDGSEKE